MTDPSLDPVIDKTFQPSVSSPYLILGGISFLAEFKEKPLSSRHKVSEQALLRFFQNYREHHDSAATMVDNDPDWPGR